MNDSRKPRKPVAGKRKVILLTLDKKIRTAQVAKHRDARAVILFCGRVFRPSWNREYDPAYVEVPVVETRRMDAPRQRPHPTAIYQEVNEEYSVK